MSQSTSTQELDLLDLFDALSTTAVINADLNSNFRPEITGNYEYDLEEDLNLDKSESEKNELIRNLTTTSSHSNSLFRWKNKQICLLILIICAECGLYLLVQ